MTAEDKLLRALSGVIKTRREALLISQYELSKRTGLHRTYIGDMEHGARNVSLRNLSRLAEALMITPSKLLATAEKKVEAEAAKRKEARKGKSK